MKMSLHTYGPQLVWNLVPWSHVVQSFKLSWQALCPQTSSSYLAPIFTTQALTHAVNTELTFLWHFKGLFLKDKSYLVYPHQIQRAQDSQLTVPQGANTEQYRHEELTNTEYLSVLQNSPETHLELNKGNHSFTACGFPSLHLLRSAFLIISTPNRISKQTLI